MQRLGTFFVYFFGLRFSSFNSARDWPVSLLGAKIHDKGTLHVDGSRYGQLATHGQVVSLLLGIWNLPTILCFKVQHKALAWSACCKYEESGL